MSESRNFPLRSCGILEASKMSLAKQDSTRKEI